MWPLKPLGSCFVHPLRLLARCFPLRRIFAAFRAISCNPISISGFQFYFRFDTEAASGMPDCGILQGLVIVAFGSHLRAFSGYFALSDSKMAAKTTSVFGFECIFRLFALLESGFVDAYLPALGQFSLESYITRLSP